MTTRSIGKNVWWLDWKRTSTKEESKKHCTSGSSPESGSQCQSVSWVWNSLISNPYPFPVFSCIPILFFFFFFHFPPFLLFHLFILVYFYSVLPDEGQHSLAETVITAVWSPLTTPYYCLHRSVSSLKQIMSSKITICKNLDPQKFSTT